MKKLVVNGIDIDVEEIKKGALNLNVFNELERDVIKVVDDWYSKKDTFHLKTSGSTGSPKKLSFSREQLSKSACRTLAYFRIKHGDRVLMCLSPSFVAGFMMIIRALEGDLELVVVSPSSNPLSAVSENLTFQFASFTPYQLESMLLKSSAKLSKVKKVLVGGVGINYQLEMQLQKLPIQIYHSYGMTETLTHVAIRSVSGKESTNVFKAIEGVTFRIDDRSCLVIDDMILNKRNLETNDIVELIDDTSFIWRGRIDNVVNSGGVKIHLEQLESEISKILHNAKIDKKFCLIAQEDAGLTNRIVLLLENEHQDFEAESILRTLKVKLPSYHDPKMIINVPKIALTNTGKVDRKENARLYLHKNKKE